MKHINGWQHVAPLCIHVFFPGHHFLLYQGIRLLSNKRLGKVIILGLYKPEIAPVPE
jgi:hypothetical protein